MVPVAGGVERARTHYTSNHHTNKKCRDIGHRYYLFVYYCNISTYTNYAYDRSFLLLLLFSHSPYFPHPITLSYWRINPHCVFVSCLVNLSLVLVILVSKLSLILPIIALA